MVESKKCPKCKFFFELNSNNFYKSSYTKSGFIPYCIKCRKIISSISRKKSYAKNPIKYHEQNIKRLYGITYNDYLELLEKQNHRCGICHLTLEKSGTYNGRGKTKHFNIDHCHETGKIRGLLCSPCNKSIGFFKHDTNILKNAIKYLNK